MRYVLGLVLVLALLSVSAFADDAVEAGRTIILGDGTTVSSPGAAAVKVEDLDDGTDGELITWDSSGVPTTVAVGTATHVLTSNGAGAEPTFQAATGGDLVNDLSPQLGGQLDVNGNAIGDGTLELVTFTETGSAVNQLNVTNAITGNAPVLGVEGETNVPLTISAKGSGILTLEGGGDAGEGVFIDFSDGASDNQYEIGDTVPANTGIQIIGSTKIDTYVGGDFVLTIDAGGLEVGPGDSYGWGSDANTRIDALNEDEIRIIPGAVVGLTVTEVGGAIAVGILGPLTTDSNAANSVAISTFENTAGDFQIFRVDVDPEASLTGSIGDLAIDSTNGEMYFKKSGSATNTGWQDIAGPSTFKSYTFHARDAASGENFSAGFYDYPTTHVVLTIGGSVTQTHGGANAPYGAHAFAVASGAGGTDLVLTVTGTSVTDAGVRDTGGTEVIVADTDAAITDQYFETALKWVGTITYTLTGSSGAFTFNYGYAKYEDFGDRAFTVTDFESVGLANANDSGFNVELLYHSAAGWTYAASGFQAGDAVLASMNTTYSTEQDIDAGEPFAFKRTGLSQSVAGDDAEGIIIRVTTGINNAVSYMDSHVGVIIR